MAAVHMGVELDALLRDLAQLCQGEDLKAAAVGQDGPVPGHESVQPAEGFDQLVAGAHMEMVGIGKLDLAADGLEIRRRERPLDRALGADVHENRCLYGPVGGCKFAAACAAFLLEKLIHVVPPVTESASHRRRRKSGSAPSPPSHRRAGYSLSPRGPRPA